MHSGLTPGIAVLLVSSWLLLLPGCGERKSPAAAKEGGSASAISELEGIAPPVAEVAAAGETTVEASGLSEFPDADALPVPFNLVWAPWFGDYDAMVERRILRVVTPYGGYLFFYEDGKPRGAAYELVRRLENFINNELKTGHLKVQVIAIPLSRDKLIPALLEGHADVIAGDLTATAERGDQMAFTRSVLDDISEVVVTGPAGPPLATLDDLAGQTIVVRASSSYYEHLATLVADFERRGLEAPELVVADEILEAEDLLEMVNGGLIPITVMDDYKAKFWSGVFDDVVVRDDLVINRGGRIAWAFRKDSPQLEAALEQFMRKYGKGTMIGNDTYNRYLADASEVRCSHSASAMANLDELAATFRKYGERYDFDWLMLAAQAFQESGLKQSRRSSAGAVGLMQIKPSTAADRNVGIDDISTVDGNVHAGAKYLRFLEDRYFSGPEFDAISAWVFALASYNAGPARVIALRSEAREEGYDPNRWFNNVEIIAAKRIGRETVTYVSNIFKYYVGYKLTFQRGVNRVERFGDELAGCVDH